MQLIFTKFYVSTKLQPRQFFPTLKLLFLYSRLHFHLLRTGLNFMLLPSRNNNERPPPAKRNRRQSCFKIYVCGVPRPQALRHKCRPSPDLFCSASGWDLPPLVEVGGGSTIFSWGAGTSGRGKSPLLLPDEGGGTGPQNGSSEMSLTQPRSGMYSLLAPANRVVSNLQLFLSSKYEHE